MPPLSGLIIRPLGNMVNALQQLYQKPPDQISGLNQSDYTSPGQPIRPIAPDGTEPKGWQYWWGQNQNYQPRPDAEYSAQDLKALATYPLARICIENLKDQICRAGWEIRLKRQPGETNKDLKERMKGDANIKNLSELFEYPDAEHDWSEWLRPLLDDLLVIDAPTILIRKTFKGEIAELRVLRGESITRLIDANGFTPQPPDPAYQQNWWGLPLVNLTTDQLIYKPRNIVPRNTVSSQLYGYSPTEQAADEIKIGIKRLEFILQYYTEGSIPGLVHIVPKGTPPEKVTEAMLFINSELAGNLAARQQWRMIPGFQDEGKQDQILETKEKLLSDPFDELHIRKICFTYGTSPQRLMRMMGTRNADAQQEASQEEGMLPILDWIKSSIVDFIIKRKMGLDDYEIVFDPFRETDLQKLAETAKVYVSSCLKTVNEVREDLGEDKRPEPEADMLGVIGGQFTPISGPGALTSPAPPQPMFGGEANGGTVSNSKPSGGGNGGPGTGAGNKPTANKSANGNGKGGYKAHCQDHQAYDETCIACADCEIKRLESLVSPVSAESLKALKVNGSQLSGPVGFATGHVATQPQLPPSVIFQKDDGGKAEQDDADEARWDWLNLCDGVAPTFKKRKKEILIRGGMIHPSSNDAANRIAKTLVPIFNKMQTKVVRIVGAKLDSVKKLAKVDDGGWITINGTHVHIGDDGTIDKGPKEMVGSKVAADVEHYHGTAVSNVDSILKHGIKATDSSTGVKSAYVSTGKDLAFSYGAGAASAKGDDKVAIVVIKSGKEAGLFNPKGASNLAYYPGTISPKNIDRIEIYSSMAKKGDKPLQVIKPKVETHASPHPVAFGASTLPSTLRKDDQEDEGNPDDLINATNSLQDQIDDIVDTIMADIEREFNSVAPGVTPDIVDAAMQGVREGLVQLNITNQDLIQQINTSARDWAEDRAAALVGMKWDDAGNLIQNPDAKWAITDSTRDQLRTILTDVFQSEDASIATLTQRIMQAGTFSEARAKMIAKTEVISAEVNSNLQTWKDSGLVPQVEWILSNDHDQDDECDEWADESPYDIDDVPFFPAHPNCECVLVAVFDDENQDNQSDDSSQGDDNA